MGLGDPGDPGDHRASRRQQDVVRREETLSRVHDAGAVIEHDVRGLCGRADEGGLKVLPQREIDAGERL